MEGEVDLINRDPNNMNNFLHVEFADVLAEPQGAHSVDCVWANSGKCFAGGKDCCYKFLSFFCGLCISLGWGCIFAYVAYVNIWILTPGLRCIMIMLHPAKKYLSIYLNAFLAPIVETTGLFLSRIHVVQSQGPPPKPLGELNDK